MDQDETLIEALSVVDRYYQAYPFLKEWHQRMHVLAENISARTATEIGVTYESLFGGRQ